MRGGFRGWVAAGAVGCLALLLLAVPVLGGGARVVDGTGAPMTWDNTAAIVYRPDQGSLGQLDNATANSLLAGAFQVWSSSASLSLTFSEGAALPFDVDANRPASTNAAHWFHFWRKTGDGLSPVIYDTDGSIVDDMLGLGARFDVLGLGSVDTPLASSCTIAEGSILINGAFFDGLSAPDAPFDPTSPVDLTGQAALQAVMVHEIGHLLNLEHSLVNHEMGNDGDVENDRYLPSMYPFQSEDDETAFTLSPDDEAAASYLYPTPSLPSSTGVISGSVLDPNGDLFQGAHVVARRVIGGRRLAFGAFSGGLYFPGRPTGFCPPPAPPAPDAGSFVIKGLPPGDYRVCVEQADRRVSYTIGTFAGPLATPAILMGPEECWDLAESGDPVTDDPEAQRIEALAAGGSILAVIQLNNLPASDAHENNDTLGTAWPLPGLGPNTQDTIAARLEIGDPDYYSFDVGAGDIIRIDVEAAEIGSPLDPIIALYKDSIGLLSVVDDAVDPDSGIYTHDPAVSFTAPSPGTYKVLVTGYPDLDLDGLGQASSGPYFLRIQIDRDADQDGTVDRLDVCLADPDEDSDHDGFCGEVDNCPFIYNPDQVDSDGDGVGDGPLCDNCPSIYNPGQENADIGDWIGDVCDACPNSAPNDADADGVCGNLDVCPSLYNPFQNGGAPVRLNGPLPIGGMTQAEIFKVSPDGARVVYIADQDVAGAFDLYSVPAGGGTPVRLNALSGPDQDAVSFDISPDGARVVYLQFSAAAGPKELFSVPIAGGTPVKLNGTLVAGGDVTLFLVTAGSRVVYRADQQIDEAHELYSVPLAGGASVKISGGLTMGGDVGAVKVTSDGSVAVYGADALADEQYEIFSVPVTGGTVTKLNASLVSGRDVTSFDLSAPADPSLARVVYVADQETNDAYFLYSVFASGGLKVRLHTLPLNASGDVSDFQVDPTGSRVVFRHDFAADEVFALTSVGIDGFSGVVISPPLSGGEDVTQLPGFAITSTGDRVVYIADADVDETYELFSVPILGGTISEIASPLIPAGDIAGFELTPDGLRAVYLADRHTDELYELYSVRVDGTEVSWKLNQTLQAAGDVGNAGISADSLTVVFRADATIDGRSDLFAVPIGSGSVTRINPDPVAGGFTSAFKISPDSRRVFYQAYQDDATRLDLYSAFLPRDLDSDLILDSCDICPSMYNYSQLDFDVDGVGNPCDNCLLDANPGQEDLETGPGSDALCGTQDDNSMLFGLDQTCGTADDVVGDGFGDICPPLADGAGPTLALTGESSFGVAWGDYDGDGDDDLYVVNEGTSNRLFRNDGARNWTDVTTGTLGAVASGRAASWGDYDNDGDPDLYVVNYLSANRLLRNDGSGLFTDVTAGPLGNSTTGIFAPWVDYDRDGDLDLYLVNHYAQNKLLRNDDGAFVEATPAPLAVTEGGTSCAWGDYDNDGDPDLYLVNLGSANRLFKNDGVGLFSDVTSGPLGDTGYGTGAAWGDYDNDGDLDLFLTNQTGTNRLLRNNGYPDWDFTDVTSGPLGATSDSRSPSWVDYDLDGDLDLYVTNFLGANRLYRNEGGAFVLATLGALQDSGAGLGAAWADPDLDGDPDLYLANIGDRNLLVYNDAPPGNHWIQIDLKGRTSNRSAIGARVQLDPGGNSQIREVTGGSGWASQDSHVLMFGLGSNDIVAEIQIRWPSGVQQTLFDQFADGRITVTEPDILNPIVEMVLPGDGGLEVPLTSPVILSFNEPLDPASLSAATVFITLGTQKVTAAIGLSADRRIVSLVPASPLAPDSEYGVTANEGVKDLAGNQAVLHLSVFETTANASAGDLSAGEAGSTASGATLAARNVGEQFGFAAAVVGDVNGDGFDDIAVGAPGADPLTGVDAGQVHIYFGGLELNDYPPFPLIFTFTGEAPSDAAGKTVAAAGDVNNDGVADFLIGAPHADPNGADSGKVYLIFGSDGLDELAPGSIGLSSLSSCVWPTPPCGITFTGAAAGDLAGAAISAAGNINGDVIGDVYPDILIGAPGADPNGLVDAGKTYLVYGPFPSSGTIPLSDVGTPSAPGLVFHGEAEGDAAGAAVSDWRQFGPGQIDDLLIGAPGATVLNDDGVSVPAAGLVYAIHGGSMNLDANSTMGVIELSRVANGLIDEVAGVVFIGTEANQTIGRSIVGSVDVDGDGQPDIVIGAEGEVWVISGDGPKGATGSSNLEKTAPPGPSTLNRPYAAQSAVSQFSAAFFTGGADGDLGGAAVARAGDVNNDGYGDVIIGAPGVDAGMEADAGKAYVVYGSPVMTSGEHSLSQVGTTSAGVAITGAAASDLLGTAVGGGGDVNGDGVDDVVVGAPFGDTLPTTPPDSGEAYIFSLLPPPVEVGPVTVTQNGAAATLEWPPAPLALSYNVYRGTMGQIPIAAGGVKTSLMTALACSIATDADMDGQPDHADADPLSPGSVHYYLVTARNQAGEGPLASVLQSPARVNDSQCP